MVRSCLRRAVGLGAVGLALVLPQGALASTNWAQFGLNPWHSSYNTSETILTRSNVGHLGLAWSRALVSGSFGVIQGAPVVAGGSVFIGSRLPGVSGWGAVAAFAMSSGAPEWSTITCAGGDVVSLAYANGLIIDTDAGYEATPMNAVTGGTPYGCTDGGPFGAIAVQGANLVYVSGGTVGETSQQLGGNVWQIEIGGSSSNAASSPAILGGVAYASNGDVLAALSEQTGSVLWSRAIDPLCNCLSANGVLFVNSAGTAPGLYAVNASTGKVIWRNPGIGASQGTPTVANGVVYDVSSAGKLTMVNSATGALIASKSDSHGLPFDDAASAQVVVVNGRVLVTTASTTQTNYLDVYKPV
jgi:outer membrane protein assembly factor BamB